MCYNKIVMAKKKRSYPKSLNVTILKPDTTIYSKTVINNNLKSTINLTVKPQMPNEPIINAMLKVNGD